MPTLRTRNSQLDLNLLIKPIPRTKNDLNLNFLYDKDQKIANVEDKYGYKLKYIPKYRPSPQVQICDFFNLNLQFKILIPYR